MSVSTGSVVKNLIWRYAERFLAQIVTFLVSLVLARVISPSDYGLVAIVTVIVSILDVFSTRGFNQALIQKKDVDDLDYSTVFFVNMLINIILYIIIYVVSPYIAIFFGKNELASLLRVLAIRILITGFNSIQQAYVQRNMQFKKFFYSTLMGTVTSAIIGVYLAYQGAGAWALVVQSLTNTCVDTIILFFTIEWKPRLEFSFNRMKILFGFGIKMLLMGIIDSLYGQMRTLVIGKVYSSSDLAYYDKGKNLPAMVVDNVQISASNVFFSALSREKTYSDVKIKMRQYLSCTYYIMCPLLVGVSVISESIITILYTDKWIQAVPYLIIYCLAYLTWVPQIPMLQAINSRGRVDKTLKMTIINRIVGIVFLIVLMRFGPIYIAIGELISNIFITLVVYIETNKMFEYTCKEMIEDILSTSIITMLMAISIILFRRMVEDTFVMLVIQIFFAMVIYFFMSLITRNQVVMFFIEEIRKRIVK